MSDETKPPETIEEETSKTEEKPPPAWEYKTEFGIHTKMKEVIHRTIDVTSEHIEDLKRKLDKLTYGS
jgi:hypothetical protein